MKNCDVCGKRSESCVKRFDVVPEEWGIHAAVLCPKCDRLWQTSLNPVRDQMRRTVVDKLQEARRH